MPVYIVTLTVLAMLNCGDVIQHPPPVNNHTPSHIVGGPSAYAPSKAPKAVEPVYRALGAQHRADIAIRNLRSQMHKARVATRKTPRAREQ